MESNNVLVGGTPQQTPAIGNGEASGLQRADVLLWGPDGIHGTADDYAPPAGATVDIGSDGQPGTADDYVPKDTQLTPNDWTLNCLPPGTCDPPNTVGITANGQNECQPTPPIPCPPPIPPMGSVPCQIPPPPCNVGTCPATATDNLRPVRPALPPNLGKSFESVLSSDGTLPAGMGSDVDGDGIPDLLDTVNLPSEATRTSTSDHLQMSQGLGNLGFLLLVEPSHQEAQLVMAGTNQSTPSGPISPAQALDLLQAGHGPVLHNNVAMVLHDAMQIHLTWATPETPINATLGWSSARPADGSWLLLRNDPTRLLQRLQLGGRIAPVAPPAASHYTPQGLQEDRWEFLNLQGALSFCFDAAGLHGVQPCRGEAPPVWLRAYSGQAAYTLQAVASGLKNGAIPVLETPVGVKTNPPPFFGAGACPPGQSGLTVNEVPACTTSPVGQACPPGQQGLMANNQTACVSSTVDAYCPGGADTATLAACGQPPVCPTGVAGTPHPDQIANACGNPVANPCPAGAQTTPVGVCGNSVPDPVQTVLDSRKADAIGVSAGYLHTCALRASGNVHCWGYNPDGRADDYTVGDAMAVSAGYSHTCTLLVSGNVHCWGTNASGEATEYTGENAIAISAGDSITCALLTNHNTHCWGATGLIPDYLGNDATAIVASGAQNHVCALLSNHNIHCWGYAWNGPTANYTGGDATAVATGYNHACAVLANQNVHCWNLDGSSAGDYIGGDAAAVSAGDWSTCALLSSHNVHCWGGSTAATVEGRDYMGGDATSISAGGSHACALLISQKINCWGDNNYGQSIDYPPASTIPIVANKIYGDAISVSAGGKHTCALLFNHNVHCWGDNLSGQAVDYTAGDATALSAGRFQTCILLTNHNTRCWGANYYGQSAAYTGGDATAISSGDDHTCVLRSNGNVHCWGANGAGQAADYTGGDATTLSAGYSHTCVLRSNGNIHCWGANGAGQAADYTGGDAVAVSAADYHTCALLTNHNVHCWGWSFGGSLDYTGGNAIAVSTTAGYACVLLSTNTVHCWGDNTSGQAPASQSSSVSTVSAGGDHGCALLSYHNVNCWGANYYGQANDYPGPTARPCWDGRAGATVEARGTFKNECPQSPASAQTSGGNSAAPSDPSEPSEPDSPPPTDSLLPIIPDPTTTTAFATLYNATSQASPGPSSSSSAPPQDPATDFAHRVVFGEPSHSGIDLFNASSPVHLLGNQSKPLPDGVGLDYLLPARGQSVGNRSAVIAIPPDPDKLVSRLFRFHGTYLNMPARPRDLTELHLHIQDADGNPGAEDFLLDGRIFGSYLNVQGGESLVASVDDLHKDGFTQSILDLNGDGVLDLLVHVPHFSDVDLTVHNANGETHADFWDVHMSSPTSGWISGAYDAMYYYANGYLQRFQIPVLSPNQRTLGMHYISDEEFWVVTSGDCPYYPGYLVHYSGGGWASIQPITRWNGDCQNLLDVWMNPSQTHGYISGDAGVWIEYTNGQWIGRTSGTMCGITDIQLNSAGQGYVGVAKPEAGTCSPMSTDSQVMSFDGSFHVQNTPGANLVYRVLGASGGWAVGTVTSQGAGVYQQSGSTWIRNANAPRGTYFGVDKDPAGALWMSGQDWAQCSTCTFVGQYANGVWSRFPMGGDISQLNGINMVGVDQGVVAGSNAVVLITPKPQVHAFTTLLPASGDTATVFSASDAGSTSNVPGPLSHSWSWGDGSTGTGSSATHTYGKIGTFSVTHRVTDSQGNSDERSDPVTVSAIPLTLGQGVSGSFPSGTQQMSRQYSITYSGFQWLNVAVTGTGMMVMANLDSPLQGSAGNWPNVGAQDQILKGYVPSGHTLYIAVVKAAGQSGGSYLLQVTETVQTASYSASLIPGATPARASYLDPVDFSVVWKRSDNAAPRNAAQQLESPHLRLGGSEYVMHAQAGSSLDYVAGVAYHYATLLPAGQSYRPTYVAYDAQAVQHVNVGTHVLVTGESLLYTDFQSDGVGSLPNGFSSVSLTGHCCNMWHVDDANKSSMPSQVSLGRHAHVAWFANGQRGDYQASAGDIPGGAMETSVIDLRLLDKPVLSFSSYYETQDLNSTYDQKLVRIQTADPNGGAWSSWSTLYTVQGYEGGYLDWKSQSVDLSWYAGKLVRLQFYFDTVTSTDNDYWGWMIDDVVVGHDHDGDGLPDVLEANLLHGGVARQIGTAIMDTGGHAKGTVRRLDRPYSENVVLTAQVHVPHPDHTTLYVGAQNDYTGETARFTVYDPGGGLRTNTCAASPVSVASNRESYNPFDYPAYKRLSLTGGDAFIRLDLARCGLAGSSFVTQSDWYLAVNDTTPSLQDPARIEGLSVESVGRTSPLVGDSDSDGLSDGLETSTAGRDPLGIDEDRDGIPEGLDANDALPEWIPAGLVAITQAGSNGGAGVRVALADAPGPIVYSRMQAHFPDTTLRELSPKPYSQSDWNYDFPSGEPDQFVFEWQDTEGGQGTLTVGVAHYTGGYAIYGPKLSYGNPSANHPATQWSLDPVLDRVGDLFSWGVKDQVFPDLMDVGKSFYNVFKGTTSTSSFALTVLGFFVGQQIHMGDEAKPVATSDVAYATRTGAGPQYIYAPWSLVDDSGRKISANDLSDAMRYGVVLKDDQTGSMRIVRETTAGPVVLRLVGTLVHDAWRWDPSSSPDWESGVGTDWFIQHEQVRTSDLGVTALGQQAPYRNCLVMCQWRTQEIHRFTFNGAGTGTHGAYVGETPIPLNIEMFQSLRSSYDFTRYLGTGFKAEADDDALGEMGIGYASWLAANKRLESTHNPTNYWDNGVARVADCQGNLASDLLTRRCSNVAVSASGASHTWSGSDNFRTHDLTWRNQNTNALQFQDDIAADASLSAHQGPTPPAGMERFDNTNRQMASTLGTSSNARVLAAFDWSTAVNPEIGLRYQEANS